MEDSDRNTPMVIKVYLVLLMILIMCTAGRIRFCLFKGVQVSKSFGVYFNELVKKAKRNIVTIDVYLHGNEWAEGGFV